VHHQRHRKDSQVRPHGALQRDARAAARNSNWQNEYRQNWPVVGRSIACLTHGTGKSDSARTTSATGGTTATALKLAD
jgi:hypothetical protein